VCPLVFARPSALESPVELLPTIGSLQVILKSWDDKEFLVEKDVICAHSVVLQQMSESTPGSVMLVGVIAGQPLTSLRNLAGGTC
jgi:hypothetical protein